MPLALLIKYWQLVVGGIVTFGLSFFLMKEKSLVTYYQSQYEKSKQDHIEYVNTQTQAYLKAEQATKDIEVKYQQIIQDQEIKSNEAIKQIQIDRNKSNTIISSLHNTVSTYQSQLSSYPLTTQVKYSITYSGLFQECATRLAEVAEQGDRESVDKMILYDSWMSMIKSQNKQINTDGVIK